MGASRHSAVNSEVDARSASATDIWLDGRLWLECYLELGRSKKEQHARQHCICICVSSSSSSSASRFLKSSSEAGYNCVQVEGALEAAAAAYSSHLAGPCVLPSSWRWARLRGFLEGETQHAAGTPWEWLRKCLRMRSCCSIRKGQIFLVSVADVFLGSTSKVKWTQGSKAVLLLSTPFSPVL